VVVEEDEEYEDEAARAEASKLPCLDDLREVVTSMEVRASRLAGV